MTAAIPFRFLKYNSIYVPDKDIGKDLCFVYATQTQKKNGMFKKHNSQPRDRSLLLLDNLLYSLIKMVKWKEEC